LAHRLPSEDKEHIEGIFEIFFGAEFDKMTSPLKIETDMGFFLCKN